MFHSKITTVILGCACLWLLLVAVSAQLHHSSSARDLAAIQDRVDAGQRDTARIARELDRMSQPGWLALLARERLNYQAPGETVVFVYPSEKSDTLQPQVTADARSNWRKWLDWMGGK